MRAITLCLLIFTTHAFAQQPTMEAELSPPVFSTLAQSGGINWVAYGYLYPVGTFANLPQCTQPEGVAPVGNYVIRGEYGNAAEHAATYRVTFGKPNEGKQFVFAGLVGFVVGESGLPDAFVFDAVRLSGGRFVEDFQIELTPRSPDCFGGVVRVSQPVGVRGKPSR